METRAPDGEDAVIAEAKPRTLRKEEASASQPASQPASPFGWLVLGLAGGRARAGDCSKSDAMH